MAMYDKPPRRIPHTLQLLLDSVSEATGIDYNFVLMNFYQDGTHSISYHSDDEKFLGKQSACGIFDLLRAQPVLCNAVRHVSSEVEQQAAAAFLLQG